MAPVSSSDSGSPESAPSNPQTEGNFHATPAAAVVIPVVLIILILLTIVLLTLYLHRRRRNDRDRLISASVPESHRSKLVPEWLSNWVGIAHTERPRRSSLKSGASFESVFSPNKPHGTEYAGNDPDSDVIALRAVDADVPLPPRPVYEARDRAGSVGVRPKKLGIRF